MTTQADTNPMSSGLPPRPGSVPVARTFVTATIPTVLWTETRHTIPNPRSVAAACARRKADVEALASGTARDGRRLFVELQAHGVAPARAAVCAAVYLETVVALNPVLRTWSA